MRKTMAESRFSVQSLYFCEILRKPQRMAYLQKGQMHSAVSVRECYELSNQDIETQIQDRMKSESA